MPIEWAFMQTWESSHRIASHLHDKSTNYIPNQSREEKSQYPPNHNLMRRTGRCYMWFGMRRRAIPCAQFVDSIPIVPSISIQTPATMCGGMDAMLWVVDLVVCHALAYLFREIPKHFLRITSWLKSRFTLGRFSMTRHVSWCGTRKCLVTCVAFIIVTWDVSRSVFDEATTVRRLHTWPDAFTFFGSLIVM